MGLFDKNFSYFDIKAHFTASYERLAKKKAAGIEGELLAINTAYARIVMKKCDLGINLKRLYDAKDVEGLYATIPLIRELISDVKHLHGLYAERYYRNNKPFGFEEKDMRFGAILARLERTGARLTDFTEGRIDSLPELEAERLTFENRETPFAHLYYIEKMRRP